MDTEKYGQLLDFEGLDKQPNTSTTDFKAETVAANLIEQGYDPSRILLIREGSFKRGFSKDINEVSLQFSANDLSDYLHIKTNRESIYDILPEGIFHRAVNRKLNPDKEDIVDEIKIHREEEFFARKFFQPFEVELDNLLIDMALFEAKFDKRISNPGYVEIFLFYWPVIKLLKREQAVLFLHTIPIIHKIRNSYADTAEALSLILDVPVHIENVILAVKEASNSFESELGKSKLGIDLILGDTFNDGVYDIKIRIGPMSALRMKDFLKGELADRILCELCRLFLPGNVFITKEYVLDKEDSVFVLSTGQTSTYLGINAFI
jgi:hypothetical protein